MNAVASIQVPVENDHPELKSTSTLLDPPGNPSAGSAASVMDSGSAESGLVNEAGEGNSAEPVKEKVQGGASDKSVPISSWYSPWSWYSSADVGEHVQLESESPGVKTISGDVVQDSRADSALLPYNLGYKGWNDTLRMRTFDFTQYSNIQVCHIMMLTLNIYSTKIQ